MVLSRNEDENADAETHYSRVTQLFVRQTDLLYHLTFADGTRLETTWNHPFWIEGSGWVETKDLKAGDLTVLSSGERLEIQSVKETPQEQEVTVYNFEVQNDHTYFVADKDTTSDEVSFVWVHNQNPSMTYALPAIPTVVAACTATGPAMALCAGGVAAAAATGCALDNSCRSGALHLLSDAYETVTGWFGGDDETPTGTPGFAAPDEPVPPLGGFQGDGTTSEQGGYQAPDEPVPPLGGFQGDDTPPASESIDIPDTTGLDDPQIESTTQGHHPWPKYLGGPKEQDLIDLPTELHQKYHGGLDKILPRQKGKSYYDDLSPEAKEENRQKLREYTRSFDEKYGTHLYDSLSKEGS